MPCWSVSPWRRPRPSLSSTRVGGLLGLVEAILDVVQPLVARAHLRLLGCIAVCGRRFCRLLVRGGAVGEDPDVLPDRSVSLAPDGRRHAVRASLAVAEHHRGTGIGRRLVTAVEDHARERGIQTVRIAVLVGNDRAEALYRELGYRPAETQLCTSVLD